MNKHVGTLAETRGDTLAITEPVETRDSNQPSKEAVTSESQQEVTPKGVEKKISVAQQIKDMLLTELLNEGISKSKLNKMMAVLVDAEKCHSVLKLRYAFLKKATSNKENRKDKNHYRYGSQTVKIGKTEFWVTNDLYKRQMKAIQEWLANL